MSSSNQPAPPRKSRGRQKVTMVKMSNESNLQVTFSKRRAGLFKKASELCTLCGSEAAIVVFSPANKVFCFGHPNVQTVIDKFEHLNVTQNPIPSHNTSQLIIEAHRNSTIRELNLELTQVESLLRAEKRRAEELDSSRKSGRMEGWFLGNSLGDFNFGQLGALNESIMEFKKSIDVKVQNDMFALANPHSGNKGNPVISGGGFGDNNLTGLIPMFNNNNNAQMPVWSNGFNPNYNYHGTIGYNDNIGQFGGPNGTNAYGSIDEALDNPMISNNTATTGLIVPGDYYSNGGGNNNISACFGSFNNIASFDPRLL